MATTDIHLHLWIANEEGRKDDCNIAIVHVRGDIENESRPDHHLRLSTQSNYRILIAFDCFFFKFLQLI